MTYIYINFHKKNNWEKQYNTHASVKVYLVNYVRVSVCIYVFICFTYTFTNQHINVIVYVVFWYNKVKVHLYWKKKEIRKNETRMGINYARETYL